MAPVTLLAVQEIVADPGAALVFAENASTTVVTVKLAMTTFTLEFDVVQPVVVVPSKVTPPLTIVVYV